MTQETDTQLRDQILQQALSLTAEDRAYVADVLESSIQSEPFSSHEFAAEWSQEIDRRIAAYERGESKAISFEESLENLRRALDAHRARSANS